MKKLTALALALIMLLALTACGGAEAPAEAPAAPEAPAAEPAPEAEAAPEAEPEANPVASDPKVKLTAASAFVSTQLPGMFWEYFKEQLETLSGGSIELDLYLGGSLCGPDEELGYLSEGSVDMIMAFSPTCAFSLPTLATLYYTPGTIEDSQEVIKSIVFDDPAAYEAIQADFTANNATLLPCFVVTSDIVFASKGEVSKWADFYEGKFGCPMDANYSDMGYKNLVTVLDADYYEAMRTGLCDSLQLTAADIVSGKFYEVANYYMTVPANRVDHWMTINTDSLNKLTEGQKEVLYQACENLLAYTAECQNDLTAQFEQVVADNGGTVFAMTDEEMEWFMYCGNLLGWQTGLDTLAVMTDHVEGMTAVVNATKTVYTEMTDYDFAALEAKYGG